MANVCLYKIMVKGNKKACYKLIDMMPLYSGEKEIILEEGSDDNFTLVFTGDCKWSVDSYTSKKSDIKPYNDEELDSISDGFGWDIPLQDKSVFLNSEIFCNSKDIDDYCYSIFVHYDKGIEIFDDCPKILHIKRGRDYDLSSDIILTEKGIITRGEFDAQLNKSEDKVAKVKFEVGGTYWYLNPKEYIIGDLVYVDGAKKGCLGKILELGEFNNHPASQSIIENIGHVGEFYETDIESIWNSYKTKERKEYLKFLGFEDNITKKKFINLIEVRWNCFGKDKNNWNEFLLSLKK